MSFKPETKIFTSQGWKYIRDLRGRDRVLVRNFLGEAEFIQPFALKKLQYEGEMVKFGGTYWAVSVTPTHRVVYEKDTALAKDVVIDKKKFLHRQFRYIREDKANEFVKLYGDFKRQVSISDEDWYTIVAYAVSSGYISKDKNPRLKFMVDYDKMLPMTSILDMMGISYHIGEVNGASVLTVNRDNNLARKLKKYLGARARRDMELPSKLIYGSSQSLMKHFISTYANLVAKPSKNRPNQLVFSSHNDKLVASLKMLCMIVGYGFSATKNGDNNVCAIVPGKISPWSVRFIEKEHYSGDVYEIDLFDGLVYVTERNLPVWMSPK